MPDSFTPHYNLVLPTPGGDTNTWGTLLNGNTSAIDTAIYNALTAGQNAMQPGGATMTGTLTLAFSGPTIVLKDTSQTLPAGLYRMNSTGAQLVFQRNTAVAGDFSTATSPLYFTSTDVPTFAQRATFGGNLAWDAGNFNPANYLPLTGGTIAGTLAMSSANSIELMSQGNAYHAFLHADTGNSGQVIFVNQAGTGTTFAITDVGDVTAGRDVIASRNVTGLTLLGTNTVVSNGSVYAGGGTGAQFQGNGNLTGSIYGGSGDLHTYLSATYLAISSHAYVNTPNDHNYEISWDGTRINFIVDGVAEASVQGAAVSDRRAKTKIKSAENRDSLGMIERVKFKSFDYKKKYGGKHEPIGIIAQESPAEWFDHYDITDLYYRDDRVMLMDALHAIKQLSARVKELEAALA